MRVVEPQVTLEWITPTPLLAIERAGRTCYKSEDKITPDSAEKFCRMIYQKGHESVVEHAVASVRIVCDRGVSHEIVRHRLASYSQESTRYCNYGKDKFGNEITLSPMMENLTEHQVARRMELWRHIEQVYLDELDEGISPQQARDNLPTCLKTELVMTANFREWKHFLKLRTDRAAHPQMRKIALKIQALLAQECPFVFGEEADAKPVGEHR